MAGTLVAVIAVFAGWRAYFLCEDSIIEYYNNQSLVERVIASPKIGLFFVLTVETFT